MDQDDNASDEIIKRWMSILTRGKGSKDKDHNMIDDYYNKMDMYYNTRDEF
jgi:hypothetical protein